MMLIVKVRKGMISSRPRRSLGLLSLLLALLLPSTYFITLLLPSTPSAWAQPPAPFITDWRVRDQNRVEQTNKTLVAGGIYIIDFKLVVSVTRPEGKLLLETSLEKVRDVFWTLRNQYKGIDTTTWTPGNRLIVIDEVEGEASFTLIGRVPENFTIRKLAEDLILHQKQNITLVRLSLATGAILDERLATITDPLIMDYERLFEQRYSAISAADTDPSYQALYTNMLRVADAIASKGLVEVAMSLLNALPAGNFPPSQKGVELFMLGLGTLSVVVVLLGAMWGRARSRSDLMARRVNDAVRRMDMLLVRLGRIDKASSEELLRLREELTKIGKGR